MSRFNPNAADPRVDAFVIVHDHAGRVLSCHAYPRGEERAGASYAGRTVAATLAALFAMQEEALPLPLRGEVLLGPPESRRSFLLTAIPDPRTDEPEAGWLIGQEIAALREEKAGLAAASAAKSRFLAVLAHEMRTPLNGVLGMAALLARTPLDPVQETYIRAIEQSGEILRALVGDLSDIALIEADRLVLREEAVVLQELVDELMILFKGKAEAAHLALSAHLDPSLPARLVLDRHRLRQVLSNLLDNALKFTESGGVTLRLDNGGPETSERQRVHFSVTDSGIGVAVEDRARIFSLFEQGASGQADKEGMGLGLFIARRFVHLMGGEIGVGPAVGGGSVFSFTLSLAHPPRQAPESPAAPEADRAAPFLFSVLVCDDDPVSLTLAQALIARAGGRCVCARHGRQALARLIEADREGSAFDFVFLDFFMPELSGMETARAIKALDLKTPPRLLALSAQDFSHIAPHDAEFFDGFLPKPLTLEALHALAAGD